MNQFKVRVIGKTSNRKSKLELFNLIWNIEDYMKIDECLKEDAKNSENNKRKS